MSTDNDPALFGEDISASSKKSKHHSDDRLIPTFQLPEEVLYEVFLWLPVKSLMQFRCVSKGIRAMIDSSIFIRNHNIHRSVVMSERDREYAIFLYQPRLHRLFSLNFDEDDNNNNLMNRGKAIELNSTFVTEGMMEGIGWCCNGIFCFRSSSPDPQSYVFWNPSNGTFRKVDCSWCLYSLNVSMGYDCVNDDYKIIRFIDLIDETSVEVYSFRKDSWRKFPRDFPQGLGRYGLTRGVCLSGVMHWLWTNNTDKSVFIAAFDLATETFTSLPLPLEARQLQLPPSHFTDFRGRLCITFLPPDGLFSGPQTIWVMEKYGVESSWTKLYTFDCASEDVHHFYFPNSKHRLLHEFTWLSWWDPEDGSFERIEIPGLLNDQALIPDLYFYEAYVYVRNLVRLDHSREPCYT